MSMSMKDRYSKKSHRVHPTETQDCENDEEKAESRERFSSSAAFILTCIGFAVGLGNIWRFPKLAYENGGGAFLIPYLCCSIVFGLPMLYFEFALGQFVQKGTSKLYYTYAPAFQGIGFTMAGLSTQLTIYYFVIVGWVVMYLIEIVTGGWENIVNCESKRFVSHGTNYICSLGALQNTICDSNSTDCITNITNLIVPAELYFDQYIIKRSPDFSGEITMNWPLFVIMQALWILCGVILWKGVEFMGKISYITTVVPYVIVGILFVQGLTLEGAGKGLKAYFSPDFGKLAEYQTWKSALIQMCFSLSIGFGGMPSMASFNPRKHNCFLDACFVVFADAFMSVFGGVAVFSILGYLSVKTNQPVEKVVREGTTLAFVAYPQAIAEMWLPWLWMFLFFLMLALLGMSSVVVNLQSTITCLCDFSPFLAKRRQTLNWAFCFFMFICTIVMCTGHGVYWFTMFDASVGGFALVLLILAEVFLVCYVYGIHHFKRDLEEILGKREKNSILQKIVGPTGLYFLCNWMYAAPGLLVLILYAVVEHRVTQKMKYGEAPNDVIFPMWTEVFGWFLSFSVLLFIPAFFVINFVKSRQRNEPISALFTVHPKHPAALRIAEENKRIAAKLTPFERVRCRLQMLFD
ncbi:unnamed protein product, partial [Mesorhabditis belari]|uniref:Transporter n=1 Tax=Mesorhabditis belari TaxID=2138241 RepID=A0AAF3EUK5_9BILA